MIDCPRILMLLGDMNGCSWWRCLRPAELLVRMGASVAIADKDDPQLSNVAELIMPFYDAVLLPRMSWADHDAGRRFIAALHRAGVCAIFECDDDLFSENVNQRIQATVEKDATLEVLEQRRLDRLMAIQICDGMTVSSPRLATVMRGLVDYPVLTVPNAIDLDWWQEQLAAEERTVPGLTIGWAGGSRPDDDIIPIAEAWARIAARFPAVTFVCYGYQPDAISQRVPAERLVQLPWRPVQDYAAPFVNFDIGCASVTDQPFNRSKTAIKCWEYSAAGAAVVASPTLYERDVIHGETGYQATSVDEWEWALADLITNAPRRKRLAHNLLERVRREHSLRGNIHKWPAAWQSIIDSFRERQHAQQNRIIVARS